MFRILVCFKVVPEYNDVRPEEWASFVQGKIELNFLRQIFNCFDEAAIETALVLKDSMSATGKEVELTAVTIMPGYADHLLNMLPAIGVDRVVCIDSDNELHFRPAATAGLLVDFVNGQAPFDLILAGKQAPPGNSGAVPLLLAEGISYPCISDVTDISAVSDEIYVRHMMEGGICNRKVSSPFVAVIGNAVHSYLRMPTLRDKLKVASYKPEHIQAQTQFAGTNLLSLQPLFKKRTCQFLSGETARQKSELLYKFLLRS